MIDDAWAARAEAVIPQGANTLSKQWRRYGKNTPPVLLGGHGPFVFDTEGRSYYDLCCSLGAVTLGHNHQSVVTAVRYAPIQNLLHLPTAIEIEATERFAHLMNAEQVRWVSSGSEASEGACRIARMATGRDLIVSVGYHCLTPDTEVLTESNGFRPIQAIRPGDRIATRNPVSGDFEWQPVSRSIVETFRGELVEFATPRVSLAVTPDHRVYRRYQDSMSRHDYRLVPAEQCMGMAQVFMTSAATWDGMAPTTITIPRAEGRPHHDPTTFEPAPFMAFLGWFLSEGYVLKRKTRGDEYRIGLANANADNLAAMRRCLDALSIRWREQVCERTTTLSFSAKSLWTYLHEFGESAPEKRIPTAIKGMSSELLRPLFDALIRGDGTTTASRPHHLYTTSRRLVDDVTEVALKLGYSTSVKRRDGHSGFGGLNPVYFLTFGRPTKRITRGQMKRVPYDGLVYCVVVPNHVMLIRRNGRIVWTGNSWYSTFTAAKPHHPGCPEAFRHVLVDVPYNDLEALIQQFSGQAVAAVIIETALEQPKPGYLEAVRRVCSARGALLIFDEVICGLRFAIGGASEHFGITPDLRIFAKSVTNGVVPAACIVGSRDLMREAWPVSGTSNGHPLAMAAVGAVVDAYEDPYGAEDRTVIQALWRNGTALMEAFNAVKHPDVEVYGFPVRPALRFRNDPDKLTLTLFTQLCAQGSVLWQPAGSNVMACWTDTDRENIVATVKAALRQTLEIHDAGRVRDYVDEPIEASPVRAEPRA